MCFSFRIVSPPARIIPDLYSRSNVSLSRPFRPPTTKPNVYMLKNRIFAGGIYRRCCNRWGAGIAMATSDQRDLISDQTAGGANLLRIAETPGTVAPSFPPRVSTTASPGSGTDLRLRRDVPNSACSCPRDRVPCPGRNGNEPEGAPSQALMPAPSPCSNGPPPRRDCPHAYLSPRAATESTRRLRAGGSSGRSAARDTQRLLPV